MKVELDEQGWQAVLAILARAPYAEVANLIGAIHGQLTPRDGRMLGGHAAHPLSNGDARSAAS